MELTKEDYQRWKTDPVTKIFLKYLKEYSQTLVERNSQFFRDGKYHCVACGEELFSSDNKFDAGCGWPSFDAPAVAENITESRDLSHGMVRTEVMCSNCGGHLGHLFPDGPTETGMRYCINSVSIDFNSEES